MRVGVDLVSVTRFQKALDRHRERFLARIFTERERNLCSGDTRRLAGRFASKEAVSKALGTGIGRLGISFQDIEIDADEMGMPSVVLYGAAKARFSQLGCLSVALSISHENEYAVAFCVMKIDTSASRETSAGGEGSANEG
ncbi:MAG: holo-ACP synthase [Saccharofermentanales bacterium]|jgi:holo-[acyl-carrier protein] synthase